MTGDGWAEDIARPVVFGSSPLGGSLYFVSFMLITAIILTNVVVAVLLEKIIEDPDVVSAPEPRLPHHHHHSTSSNLAPVQAVPLREPSRPTQTHTSTAVATELAALRGDVVEALRDLRAEMAAMKAEHSEALRELRATVSMQTPTGDCRGGARSRSALESGDRGGGESEQSPSPES